MRKLTPFLFFSIILSGQNAYGWDYNKVISTDHSSLVLSGNYGEEPRFSHYGAKVDSASVGSIHDLWVGMNRPAYPVFGSETEKPVSLQLVHADGNPTLFLATESVNTIPVDGGTLTTVKMRDKAYPLIVELKYRTINEADVIEMWTEITNNERKPVVIKRMDSGFLPVRQGDVWLTHLHGSWAAENQITSEPLSPGMKTIRNLDGARNGQADQPSLMLTLGQQPSETSGNVIGATLCWSGNYDLRIDTENDFCHNLMAGVSSEAMEYRLEPGQSISLPSLAITYSSEGLSGASRNFHKWARAGAIHGGENPRDILLNSWEGVYLDVDETRMNEMMRDFASLGGELFVMDDGWFGEKYPRKQDNAALGDWKVDREKLPGGIESLIRNAKENGLKFGIWIEPESVNSLSELYEKHPDWVLKTAKRDLIMTRGGTQMLLDLSNPKVQDFVFSIVDELLSKYPEIAYIKWDANTSIKNFGSQYLPADKQMQTMVDYHLGLENILKRIRKKYPDVVMQACGGGGGRVNYGVMPYFDEVWVSDNTDALQRIYMQWGTSMFYPSMTMAQHVSASPNHQTGRQLPLKFRFDVAMTGRLGMELQPSAMSDEEKDFAKRAIADYKTIRNTVQLGNQYRLISPYDDKGVASLMYVDPEREEAVFFAYKLKHYRYQKIPRFYMAGLDPEKSYRITELTIPSDDSHSHLDGKVVPGRYLMEIGFEVPLGSEYASRVLRLEAIK